jgi:hypothetical protein
LKLLEIDQIGAIAVNQGTKRHAVNPTAPSAKSPNHESHLWEKSRTLTSRYPAVLRWHHNINPSLAVKPSWLCKSSDAENATHDPT